MKNTTKTTQEQNNEIPVRWGILRSVFLLGIRLYQRMLSPILGGQCRFYPSCSDYALLNFSYRPIVIAFFSSVWRIIRCNPWNKKTGVEYPFGIKEKQADDFLKHNSYHFHRHKEEKNDLKN